MLRVLMVLEDYGELMFLQTVLKKIGLDVEGIQNPTMMGTAILKVNPDVLIMTADGKRVNGLELSKYVKRLRGLPHIMLVRSAGVAPDPDPNIEGWVESPVVIPQLLRVVAELCEIEKGVLEDKFQKLQAKELEEEKERILRLQSPMLEPTMGRGTQEASPSAPAKAKTSEETMKLKPTTLSDEDRKAKYAAFLDQHPPVDSVLARKAVHLQVEDLRKAQTDGALELERERRAFVSELFKKKS